MKQEIVSFVKEACKRFNLRAYYMISSDTYILTLGGRAVSGFGTEQFYQIPKKVRMQEFLPLIKVGLSHNLGEAYRDQVYMPLHLGKRIA
jgi:hypothetical protein